MLIAHTFQTIMREALAKATTLDKNSHEIAKFEELCVLLRQEGNQLTESLHITENHIHYTITPNNHGDYLAIVDAMCAMGAHRLVATEYEPRDIINPQPDAPPFFLSIPLVN